MAIASSHVWLSILALLAASLVPAVFARIRGATFTDARIVFPVVYLFATSGATIWWGLTGWYYSGIVQHNAASALLSCASAILAFQTGAWLVAIHGTRSGTKRKGEGGNLILGRLVAVIVWMSLFMQLGCAMALRIGTGSANKSYLLYYGDPLVLRLFRLSAAFVLVFGLLLICVDSVGKRRKLSFRVLMMLLAYGLLCIWSGERDVVFLILAALLANAAHIRLKRLLVLLACIIGIMALIPITRRGGNSLRQQSEVLMKVHPYQLLGSLLTQTSSNFFVYTNVIEWVPEWESFKWGRTYYDAVASFIPSESSEQNPVTKWFKDKYAPSSMTGYGFGMEAEAYLNFGWFGPIMAFFLWGSGLMKLSNCARRNEGHALIKFLWLLALMASLYSIRMYSRVLLKIVVYGSLLGYGVLIVSHLDIWRHRVFGNSKCPIEMPNDAD